MTRRVQKMTPEGVRDDYGARAESALLDALDRRRPPGSGLITSASLLGDLLIGYIARCRDDGELAPKSVDTYAATINAVKSRFVGIRVCEADPGLLNEILLGIRRDHGATRERHTKVALNSVLTAAVLANAITNNPVRELPTRRRGKTAPKTKGAPALDDGQVRKLLATLAASVVCREKDLGDAVTILAATGFRRSELLGLRWQDIDLDDKVATASGRVVRVKGQGLVRLKGLKSGDDRRSVSLPRFAVDVLRKRKDGWQRPNTAGVIFPSSTGTLRDPDNFGKQWREVRDDLGLPEISSHSFRRTIATLIDDEGLSARIGADQLGHARPSMTQDVYMSRGRVHTEVARVLDKAVGISDE
ncbi:site-specific integrase [Mycolicibacterium sp. CBMA 226]|uniref:tyrosine-type recombinase/integrase n=1 Tax=Mycolicibacterium sp. CBMA 226 TaxID=2606611 RepID=UPI0028BE86E7|nr:site-specific integrase [Mycolicibacterium sp. CBMA 226]